MFSGKLHLRLLLLVSGLGLGVGLGACAAEPGGSACSPGTLNCACSNGQCLSNLECIGGFCIGVDGGTDGTSPGDGDGDPDTTPGDGDGDNPCDPGLSFCGGKCVDTQSHPLHCGGCDMGCGAGEVCVDATCEFIPDCTMAECPGFSYCDQDSMQCLPGCDSDDQCAGGESCDLGTHECECVEGVVNCTDDFECPSGACYVVPFLGGMCGECNSDSDCENGCTAPNVLSGSGEIGPNCLPVDGSVCNDGGVGAGCESDAACQGGLTCATAFNFAGLLDINACSECGTDADCDGGQLCVPIVDLSTFSGQLECVAPGSIADDELCDLEGNGDQACQSGVCSVVDVMGLAEIGACGDCNSDLDCGGADCVYGEWDLESGALSGSTCV